MPLTQREIKNLKKEQNDSGNITIVNTTNRMIQVQIRDNNSDFYVGEHTIRIGRDKIYTDKNTVFNKDQIKNLAAKGEIKIIGNLDQ